MCISFLASAGTCSSKNLYSFQVDIGFPLPFGNMKELAQKVDDFLKKNLLKATFCPHIIDQLSLLYKSIEQLEREGLSASGKLPLALNLIGRIQDAIRFPLSLPGHLLSPRDLISLHYLSQFSPIVPTGAFINGTLLQQVRDRGGNFTPAAIAQQMPYCVSKEQFLHDLRVLTGLDQEDTIEISGQSVKISELARLRERRLAFLEQQGVAYYPPYLDQLLEGGFLHLYDYLLSLAECVGENRYRTEIRQFGASEISRVVLDVRHAIVRHVTHAVSKSHKNIVFLVGNTGAGKSTTAAFLRGECLKRKEGCYEVPGQDRIGHSLTVSHTFLPNVHIHPDGVYVDFPGFSDTRGDLIDLGIELAFKTLVNCYKPKIVIVESIKAFELMKGGHVVDLRRRLTRMLGESTRCTVFLTQYLQLVEYSHLERALEEKQRLKAEIAKLRSTISKRKEVTEELGQKLLEMAGEDKKKIGKCRKKLQKLRGRIAELEEKRHHQTLNSFEEKTLASFLKKLPKQEKKLQKMKQGNNSSSGKQQIEKQIRLEEEKSNRCQNKILANSKVLKECKKQIQLNQERIKEKTRKLLGLLGIVSTDDRVAELRELEDPTTLSICKEVLNEAKPIEKTHRKLSDSYRIQLLEVFKRALTNRGIPPPPPLEFDDLRHCILETSLTSVLTAEHFPEVREFLHLPEMELECVEELDCHIVSEFSDALIRLVVIGSIEKEPEEDLIKDFVEKQIANLGEDQKEEAIRLTGKWQALKERVMETSRVKVADWGGLEQHYRSRLKKSLEGICERSKRHLEEWDRWTTKLFGLEGITEPTKSSYDGNPTSNANQLLVNGVDDLIEILNCSFDQIRELQKIVENKKQVEEQWEQCRNALGDPANFLKKIQKIVKQTQQIYNKNARGGEVWAAQMEKINARLQANSAAFCSILQTNYCLVDLMCLELCSQAVSNDAFIYQLSQKSLEEEGIGQNFSRVVVEIGARVLAKNPEVVGGISGREVLGSYPGPRLVAQLVLGLGKEVKQLAELASELVKEQALRTELVELTERLVQRVELAELEAKPETERESLQPAELEVELELERLRKLEIELKAVSEAVSEAELVAGWKAVSKAELEAKLEAELEAKLVAELEAVSEAVLKAELEAVLETASKAVPKVVSKAVWKAVWKAELEAVSEAELKAVSEAVLRAELEPRLRAVLKQLTKLKAEWRLKLSELKAGLFAKKSSQHFKMEFIFGSWNWLARQRIKRLAKWLTPIELRGVLKQSADRLTDLLVEQLAERSAERSAERLVGQQAELKAGWLAMQKVDPIAGSEIKQIVRLEAEQIAQLEVEEYMEPMAVLGALCFAGRFKEQFTALKAKQITAMVAKQLAERKASQEARDLAQQFSGNFLSQFVKQLEGRLVEQLVRRSEGLEARQTAWQITQQIKREFSLEIKDLFAKQFEKQFAQQFKRHFTEQVNQLEQDAMIALANQISRVAEETSELADAASALITQPEQTVETAQEAAQRAWIASALSERAAELKELAKVKDLAQREEEVAELLVAVAGVGKAIAHAERLLEVEEEFEEEDFLHRVRSINRALAKRLGLSLDISLHRILLLDFLMVNRFTISENS